MTRKKSQSHQIMEALNRRTFLDQKSLNYLSAMTDGFTGEVDLDGLTKISLGSAKVLKDVRLRTPLGDCQIDTLVIRGGWLLINECKNYSGEFMYEPATLTRSSNDAEFENPEMQLNRHSTRLKSLLKKYDLTFKIAKKVIYINPNMLMFNAPKKNNFLMRSQIEPFLEKFADLSDYPNHQHARLLKVLKENECEEIRYDSIPDYTYEDLKKGMFCLECESGSIEYERNVARCKECPHSEKIADMLDRTIEEFKLLFPEVKLKHSVISEWCGNGFSRSRIDRALKNNIDKEYRRGSDKRV